MSLSLNVHGLTIQYASHPVLQGLEFSIEPGAFVALIGANGAGKSTLLRSISRVLLPSTGAVYLDNVNIQQMSARELARLLAVVPQECGIDFDFSVEDIVLMGRFPYMGFFQKETLAERKLASNAMEMTGVAHLAQRSIATLSGGEKQRVMIARAICQEPKMLLLDEPTANLDIGYQYELLETVANLNREMGITVLAAIHDLNLAAQFFERFILLAGGKVLAAGQAEEVITTEHLKISYGVSAVIFRHPLHGHLQVSVPKQQYLEGQNTKGIKGKGSRVHVIGGGAEALPALEILRQKGCCLSIGPVTAEDSGYQYATFHGIPVIEIPPFSPISDKAHNAHLSLLKEAELVVVPPIPFGPGNLRNLQAVEEVMADGRPVFLLENGESGQRDYTGGEASAIIRRLKKKGAFLTTDTHTIVAFLHGHGPANKSKGGRNEWSQGEAG